MHICIDCYQLYSGLWIGNTVRENRVTILKKVYSSIGLDNRFSFCKEQFDSAIDYYCGIINTAVLLGVIVKANNRFEHIINIPAYHNFYKVFSKSSLKTGH